MTCIWHSWCCNSVTAQMRIKGRGEATSFMLNQLASQSNVKSIMVKQQIKEFLEVIKSTNY